MKISLITSLFKSNQHLERYFTFLKHFRKQSLKVFSQIEVIIIANEPNEFELAILDKNRTLFDKMEIVRRESLYASWNRGIRLSTGDVIGFWNVDDIRFAGCLKILKNPETFRNHEIFYFNYIISGLLFIKRLKPYISIPFVYIKFINPIVYDTSRFNREMHLGPFFLFKRTLIEKIGYFDESYKISGDFEWASRAALLGASFIKVNKYAGLFLIHGSNLSGSSNNNLQKEENIQILEKISREENKDFLY